MPDADSRRDLHHALQFALCLLVLFCIVGAIASDAEWMLWVACGVTSLALILWVVAMARKRADTFVPRWFMPVPVGWRFRFYVEDYPVIGLDSHEPTTASGQGAMLLAKYDDEIGGLAPYVSNMFIWPSNIVPVDDASNETAVTVYIGLDGQAQVEQTESWLAGRWHGGGTLVMPPTVGADMGLSNSMNDSDLLEIRVSGSESARAKFDISGYRQLVAALAGVREYYHNA